MESDNSERWDEHWFRILDLKLIYFTTLEDSLSFLG